MESSAKAQFSERSLDRAPSLDQALRVLNDAATESAEEIRNMINRDFEKLQEIFSDFSDRTGGFQERLSGLRETFGDATDGMSRKVHQNPWTYIAGAAAISVFFGFMLGRR